MDFGSNSRKIKYQVRSISLPARSHPSTVKIEEQLSHLDSCFGSSVSSSSSVVHRLGEIYISLEELLHMPSTHKVLSQHKKYYFMDAILEGSMEMLDVCGILRDNVLQIKEQLQSLQSALRRKTDVEAAVLEYNRFRKKIRKESMVKVVSSLKQMAGNNFFFTPPLLTTTTEQDYHLVAVIRVLRQVNMLSISAFQSLSSFLSSEPRPPPARWSSAISRLVGMETDEVGSNSNELESVDASLRCLCKLHTTKMHPTVQKQLKELETSIGDIEEALNLIFRRMIKSRTSLLNIISQ